MGKSSKQQPPSNPSKPSPDYPLFPHATGRWAKKVRGKLLYFGKIIDDPKGERALAKWLDQRDDLLAGRVPREKRGGLTIHEGVNLFLDAKKHKLSNGMLALSTFAGYKICCRRIKRFFGGNRIVEDLRPGDFEKYSRDLAKTNGLVGIANHVRATRMVFRYLYENEYIDKPIKFGSEFKQPDKKLIRKQRKSRMYEAHEVRRMLDAAGPALKAMILLGVNCGFGNGDVERLPLSAVNLETGWMTYARPKTGTDRSIPLWEETVAAIKAALADRPKPTSPEHAQYVFLTSRGRSWCKEGTRYLSEQFRYFLQHIDDHDEQEAMRNGMTPPAKLYRPGIGFYCLRHVFETIGGESRDQVAVDAVMGHERGDMASIYRERVSDERLANVVNTVRAWLWPAPSNESKQEPEVKQEAVPYRVVGWNRNRVGG
jgi:integrase